MGQVGHFKMTHLYHPPFHMAHPSRGTPLDAYRYPRQNQEFPEVDLLYLRRLAHQDGDANDTYLRFYRQSGTVHLSEYMFRLCHWTGLDFLKLDLFYIYYLWSLRVFCSANRAEALPKSEIGSRPKGSLKLMLSL